jgi:ligand-binding SRPBCC domain-containing protein
MDPQQIKFETKLDASPVEVFEWHRAPDALSKLNPPSDQVQIVSAVPLEEGNVVELRIKMFFNLVQIPWVSKLENVVWGSEFADRQVRGPFKYWYHRHIFEDAGYGQCLMRDLIEFVLPGGSLSNALFSPLIKRNLHTVFSHRHGILLKEFGATLAV